MLSTTALIILLFIILFILLGRELVCWYFKINQRIDLLQEISDKLDFRPPPADLIKKQ